MSKGTNIPYEVNPELTGISLAYRNTDYIADKVLPRVAVTQKAFQYRLYSEKSFLTVPESEIGRTGMPNKMSLQSKLELASLVSQSLEAEVPQEDVEEVQASGADEDPIQDNTLLVTDGLALSREVRCAKLLSDSSNYGKNVMTLSGTDQLTDKTSSVIDLWKDIKQGMLMPPTHAVVSDTYSLYLQTHPEFIGMFKGDNANNKGMVPLEFIAQQLGLKEIFVGRAKVNAANEGQEPKIEDVWGRDLLFIHQNPLAKPKHGMTFGFTAQKGQRQVQTFYDGRPGSHGVNYIKAVEDVKELIAAPSCGFLIKDAFKDVFAGG